MSPFLRIALLLLLTLTSLRAQIPTPEDQVSLQFRLMAWEGDIPALFYGRNQTVEATEVTSRSPICNYTGPVTLTFTLVAKKTDDRTPPPIVATVTLPKNAQRITLLTVPLGHAHYGMYVIPDDPAALPPKHARIHNLTNDRLLIAFNSSDHIELAPGASDLVSGTGKAVVIRVAKMTDGQWRQLFNNVIAFDTDGGSNVLLIHGRQGAGLGMFALPGWPKSPTPPAPQ